MLAGWLLSNLLDKKVTLTNKKKKSERQMVCNLKDREYLANIGLSLLHYLTFTIIRVKLIIEEIEREEAALREDLYAADRKCAEYYNVCE